MRKRRKRITTRKKRFIILNAFLVVFLLLGMGYSVLGTNLNFTGNIQLKEYMEPTLYNVLKQAAKEGTYAKEYTGAHQDSMAGVGSEKIYHWYGSNDANGTAILDKNNVIFANHCWQMLRTTDTGGVKMIYNGEVEDGKCLNTRGAHVGYKNETTQNLLPTYYYGTSYTYDEINNVFSLNGTITTGNINLGEYTCKSTSQDGTCATLYLVDALRNGSSSYYVIQLNGNSNYSQFGTIQFNYNSDFDSLSYSGYMYNTVYPSQTKPSMRESFHSTTTFNFDYYVGDDIVYDSISGMYSLVNSYKVRTLSDTVGKYTFLTKNSTGNKAYYISSLYPLTSGTQINYITLEDGHNLEYYNHSYTYGDSYTDNGDGTYTINSPETIYRIGWHDNYSSISEGKYVCKNAIDDTCSELWYTLATYENQLSYLSSSNVYTFSKGFSYDGSKYILTDGQISFWNYADAENKTNMNNAHYTCWNDVGECTTISYVYYIRYDTNAPHYIDITDGKSVGDAINEMLYDNEINSVNSTMKSGIEAWYKKYLLDYDMYIEDTIFCDNRNVNSLSGWNPNGGLLKNTLSFSSSSVDLFCQNVTDQFSVSNNSAKLSYKVGLMTYREAYLLGDSSILGTGQKYWLVSPFYLNYDDELIGYNLDTSGSITHSRFSNALGVRPVISVKPDTEYSSGTGSMDDPYIVRTN